MDGLYHAIGPSIKREYPSMLIDPKKFFNFRVRRNLHICIALTPNGTSFQTIIKHYSTLISNCQIYWVQDWHESYLLAEARFFMSDRLNTDELRDKLAKCMSEIHLFMLNECRQIDWAGCAEREIKMQIPIGANVATNSTAIATTATSINKMSEIRSKIRDHKNSKQQSDEQQLSQPTTMVIKMPNLPYAKNMLQEMIR